ncbi:hypothetical protein [Sphingomonas sp.]|uniref:hypothetical protein n=1 Tax=Sphingomonas sp. TaxID=28214 RepID=UPI0031CEA2D0
MGEPEDDDDPLSGESRWVRIAVLASVMVVFCSVIGLWLTWALTTTGETASVGFRGGQRIPISPELARVIFIGAGALLLVVLAMLFAGGLRYAWRAPDPSGSPGEAGLNLGEHVKWVGRPGWSSLTGAPAFLLLLTVLGPVLIGWWILGTPIDGLFGPRGFWALLLIGLLFGSIVPAILFARRTLSSWVFDSLGTVAVTDRRIVWLSPMRGLAYREIAGDSIIGAALVDRDGRRGWVSVTQQVGADVEEHDLFGLSDPEGAVAAIEALSLAQARELRFPVTGGDLGA